LEVPVVDRVAAVGGECEEDMLQGVERAAAVIAGEDRPDQQVDSSLVIDPVPLGPCPGVAGLSAQVPDGQSGPVSVDVPPGNGNDGSTVSAIVNGTGAAA
jgi:hypothetical protein